MADFDPRNRDLHGPDDPIDALRDAWNQVDTPEATRTLAEEDDVSREAVQWMAEGWKQIPIPQPTLPSQQSPSGERIAANAKSAWVPSLVLAAAALFLAAATWRFMQPQNTVDPLTDQTANAEGDGNADETDPGTAVPDQGSDATQAQLPSVQLIANDEEKVQILAGKVRLTMLRGAATATATENDSTEY